MRNIGRTMSNQPIQKDKQINGLDKFLNHDAYLDFMDAKAGSTQFNDRVCDQIKQFEENDKVDADWKSTLLGVLYLGETSGRCLKRKEKDDHSSEEISDSYSDFEDDPKYEVFLKHLHKHEKSYVLETGKDGQSSVIKYEGESTSDDEESEQEPRRKLRSAMKQKVEISNQTPHAEGRKTSNLKSRSKTEGRKVGSKKCSASDAVPEPDYNFFLRNTKYLDGYLAYTYGGQTVVYDRDNGDVNNQKKVEHDEGSSSEVEILDSTSFYMQLNMNSSEMNKDCFLDLDGPALQSTFRQQVISVLRKPFDVEEYDKLWDEVQLRKPELRHLELRGQRERSCPTSKDGKSYLDHHPDFERLLLRFEDDEPKCMNLLRGFFFWLQNCTQNGAFKPWKDAECLAVYPESC